LINLIENNNQKLLKNQIKLENDLRRKELIFRKNNLILQKLNKKKLHDFENIHKNDILNTEYKDYTSDKGLSKEAIKKLISQEHLELYTSIVIILI